MSDYQEQLEAEHVHLTNIKKLVEKQYADNKIVGGGYPAMTHDALIALHKLIRRWK